MVAWCLTVTKNRNSLKSRSHYARIRAYLRGHAHCPRVMGFDLVMNTVYFLFLFIYHVKYSYKFTTRSTRTVHTSAKARLTSVAIWIRIPIQIFDLDHHQNLIVCSLAHCQLSLQISCKSVGKFLYKIANRQTDIQRRKNDLLGGGCDEKSASLIVLLNDRSVSKSTVSNDRLFQTFIMC